MIIIPASNASPGYDGGCANERGGGRERGRESFLAKLLTALRISARETLATRPGQAWPVRAGAHGNAPLRATAPRGHSKLGVRRGPRIYEVTFLRPPGGEDAEGARDGSRAHPSTNFSLFCGAPVVADGRDESGPLVEYVSARSAFPERN